ncbi:MAG TPA: phosphate signaling complex protein PhoU [Chthonomonadaceae bacterium]|nr:phosphate signaling complex protein PhoU [Chthonomonadaceae bacterium]
MSTLRQHFEQDLERISEQLLEMGLQADTMLDLALRALRERSVPLAEQVIAADDEIDALDLLIEAECMRLIALQQPTARDLRLIGTALKVIKDLERIGDHAVDIAKVARKLAHEPFQMPAGDLLQMAQRVRQMLKDALTAFLEHDLELVEKVVADDDVVDALFHEIRSELHGRMQQDASLIVPASYLLFVAHYLERVADHTVNIAERVHYVETGQLAQLAKSHRAGS